MREIVLLHLEDSDADAELVRREIERDKLPARISRVKDKRGFLLALDAVKPDIIVSDYSIPGYGGRAALEAARARFPDVPCLIVTGSLNDETAVSLLKAGAADYVLKENMARLGPALRAALEHQRSLDDKRLADEALRRTNECLLSFGPDSLENIGRLAALCGELLDADCVLYRRLEREAFCTVAQWRVPEDFNAVEKAEGCLCLDVIRGPADRLLTRRGLEGDGLARYGFMTYLGRPVRRGGQNIGAFCALYKRDFNPEGRHERSLALICAAAGLEEDQLAAEAARERLAEELRQSQKMEAIGRLAGGVAHDFNNALTAIQGHAELMLLDKALGKEAQDDAKEILKATDYAASLTRQLLAFSRKQLLSPKILDLNATANGLAKLLERTAGAPVRLKFELPPGVGAVKADPGQMEQVLMNLALNARDSMPEGGTLTIATGEIQLDGDSPLDSLRGKPGRYVTLSVSDSGHGMDAETLTHIFEPFFTTKGKGRGTGLGLSTVYGIVRQSGGDIAVESEPGRGTRFTIYLPRVEGRAEAAGAAAPSLKVTGGDETVLLVEDEAPVRALFAKVLRNAGYRVLEAPSAEEALDASARHAEAVHILVTDVVMPGLNGRQLALRLQPLRPSMKVLYVSGYTDDAIVKSGLLPDTVAFLQKPFSPSHLALKVREVLDA